MQEDTGRHASVCRVVMHGDKECGRPPYGQGDRCVCHSDDPSKDAAAFGDEVSAVLASSEPDLSRFVFPPGWTVSGATLPDSVCYEHAVFLGDVSFERARFGGAAVFDWASFKGEASFRGARFLGEASFEGTDFEQGASFLWVVFSAPSRFSHASFGDLASFQGTEFGGEAVFAGTRFADEANFNGAVFRGEVAFVGDWLIGAVFAEDAGADFTYARFGQPTATLFCQVSLRRAQFLGTDVREVDFTDVTWARRPGGGSAVWDEFADPETGTGREFGLVAQLYRRLKENYEEQRDYVRAGDFHFGEMEMRRLADPHPNRVFRLLAQNLSLIALYRFFSGYGESYRLAGVWILGTITAFAALFAWVPGFSLQTDQVPPRVPHPVQGFWQCWLYSAMCFLLRSDRPFRSARLRGDGASLVEGVLGAVLVALFVLAVNRRLKR